MTKSKHGLTRLPPRLQPMPSRFKPGDGSLSFTDARRGSRHERGYGAEWDRLRKIVMERDQYLCKCAECRAENRLRPATEVDHVVPKAQGGTDALDNLQAINRDCHRRKTVAEMAAQRGGEG